MSTPNPPPNSSSSPNTPQPPTSIPKKIPPLPWTHLETVNLIEAYQEKWYSLKRGQLKASQWEEVAKSVATRCGFKDMSKTSTQCRHKMEKLRKRYRGEKQRGVVSVWNYFEMMDLMERGPFPISAARPVMVSQPQSRRVVTNNENSSEEEDEEEEEDEDEVNKSRSINHILRRPPPVASPIFDALPLPSKYGGIGIGSGGGGSGVGNGSGGPGVSRFLRNPMFRKRKRSYEVNDVEEEEEEEEGEEAEGEGGRLLSELASVIRSFGEGFVKVENMKLEMMKETEMHRIEMEKKRMEMILESQRSIVDAIAKTFDSQNKSKKTRETQEESS